MEVMIYIEVSYIKLSIEKLFKDKILEISN